jgi:cytochrome c peroxidase
MRTLLAVAALTLAATVRLLGGAGSTALGAVPYPGGKAPSAALVDLGKTLFFDTRLSSNDAVSCGTCHKPERGFGDGLRFSAGVSGTPLKRHTPHLYNLAWNRAFFWDGRVSSLEEQAVAPIRNMDEMGMPGDAAAAKLRNIPRYAATFGEVFSKGGVSMDNIARALAAFERTIVSKDSPADRYAAGDVTALPEPAVRGRALFFGRAMCSTCHGGPNFTDGSYHNTGVMSADQGRAAFDRVGEFQMRPYPFFQMRQAFKTPSLRNVALTAPYQHDGSEASLIEVVTFYNRGGRDPRSYGKSLDIRPLNLADGDVHDIVAFLEALTGVPDFHLRP